MILANHLLAGGELPLHSGPVGDWRPFARSTCYLDSQVNRASLQDDEHLILLYCLGILRSVLTDPSSLWQE